MNHREEQQTNNNPQQAKADLRARVRVELRKMSPDERAVASRAACLQLGKQPIWSNARAVLFYAPLPEELDVWQLLVDTLAAGKTVALPRFIKEKNCYVACQIKNPSCDVELGEFRVREPMDSCGVIALNHLDLVLVPGIAFDLNGYRLGRGKGIYDRLLAVPHGPACGVAFDQQIVSQIPLEPHDIRLNCILTPTRWQFVTSPRAVLK